jgi:hypothetical protein
MIRRRALAARIKTEIGCHTFRATGITAYVKKRWQAGDRPANGRSRISQDDRPLSPAQR